MLNLYSKSIQDFYRTSPMREGILNWYPFDEKASVLESSGGALTDFLRSHCTIAETFNGDYKGESKFDYIVVIDPGEITSGLLKKYHSLLNEHGCLLMAFENSYGLQYFAGKRNLYTGLPYNFQNGVNKAEVENSLKLAGFAGQKWYYPFTNHYLTQEIYSDNFMPNEFLNHRGQAFIEDDYTKGFDERVLWKEIIRGGAFPFLCNSYLVEARVCADDKECNVDFAAITAYRESSKAFITTVHSDGTAKKRAVFDEGKVCLKSLDAIHKELEVLGVNVLPVNLEGDSLIMKRLNLPTIWDYWSRKLIEGRLEERELFSHYDRIYEEIKKSSVQGRIYWELVPANCFYDADKDELIFFDQEFFWEGFNPDVVIVRAIYALILSVEFHQDPRINEWIDKLKKRYGLTNKWDELSKIAFNKTHEYVFNTVHTEPVTKSAERVVWHMEELQTEREREFRRYKKMCITANALKDMNINHTVIYGYGVRGKMLRYVLEENGIDIACIIDKSLPNVRGVPLFPTIEEVAADIEMDVIIVTPLKDAKHMADDIRLKTRCHVVTVEEITNG